MGTSCHISHRSFQARHLHGQATNQPASAPSHCSMYQTLGKVNLAKSFLHLHECARVHPSRSHQMPCWGCRNTADGIAGGAARAAKGRAPIGAVLGADRPPARAHASPGRLSGAMGRHNGGRHPDLWLRCRLCCCGEGPLQAGICACLVLDRLQARQPGCAPGHSHLLLRRCARQRVLEHALHDLHHAYMVPRAYVRRRHLCSFLLLSAFCIGTAIPLQYSLSHAGQVQRVVLTLSPSRWQPECRNGGRLTATYLSCVHLANGIHCCPCLRAAPCRSFINRVLGRCLAGT